VPPGPTRFRANNGLIVVDGQEKPAPLVCGGGRCRNIEAFNSEPKAWFLSETETDGNTFGIISLWGKFGGLFACGATFSYIVPPPNIFLTRLFSKTGLKRKDFQAIARLAWAQEAPGSNPGAPTNSLFTET